MTAPLSASNHNADVETNSRSTNISQEARGSNIKVAVRLRPIWGATKRPRKKMGGDSDVVAWNVEKVGSRVAFTQRGCARGVEGRTVFHLDQVFDEEAHTLQIYQSIARPMLSSVLNGKHATIFAYGQTGSGKTFTMQGEGENKSGIIAMVTADLFRSIEASKRAYEVKVSYFEIYNEKIRDLLVEEWESASSNCNNASTIGNDEVKIRTNVHGNIVLNAKQKKIDSADDALMILFQGNTRRTVAATDMNALSSRSHAVFRLSVQSHIVDEHQPMNLETMNFSDFNLVDLAGSESLKATKATGARQREGATINKSLLALTTVINALSQPSKKKSHHINYRDSKLTRILQPHLSGNAEVAILCCASRSKDFIEETRSTLKFALRAKQVQIKRKFNEVMDDSTIITNLQSQLHEVRKQLRLTEERLQEALARKSINIKSTVDAKKILVDSLNHAKVNRSLPSNSSFQPNIMNPVVTKKYERDHSDVSNSEDYLESSQDSRTGSRTGHREEINTLQTIQDSTGGPQTKIGYSPFLSIAKEDSFDVHERIYSTLSLNPRTQVSNPETIRELLGGGSQDSETLCPNGRLENNVSWDTVAFGNESFIQNEQPFRTIDSLNDKSRLLIPAEITIIDSSTIESSRCLTDRLKDVKARIEFLEGKLESSDIIIEAGFRDLQRARFCIRDLVERNTEMKVKLRRKEREDMKEKYEKGEIVVEQYWILKMSLYGSVIFFLSGSREYFLASAFFVWLTLEMNITA